MLLFNSNELEPVKHRENRGKTTAETGENRKSMHKQGKPPHKPE
jgi:hypothetical protein